MESSPDAPYDDNGSKKYTYGWYIKLDGTDRTGNTSILDPGEKVLAPATVFNGEVFFSTYQLKTGERAGCAPGNLGISRLYHLNYRTAEAVLNYDLENDLTSGEVYNEDGDALVNERSITGENGEILQRTDRVTVLGEGIPSGTVTIVTADGTFHGDNTGGQLKIRKGSTIERTRPVYWMQW
jgi:type IV pilus assembly protein PilY1